MIKREFFRGWRRKIGVVTLLLACMFAAGWLRSFYSNDFFEFRLQPISCSFSVWSCFVQMGIGFATSKHMPGYVSFETSIPNAEEFDNLNFEEDELNISFGFFSITPHGGGSGDGLKTLNYSGRSVNTYYKLVVFPLTLISLWLLLSKPRKSTQKIITESVPESVA